jgi:hypothetical protein
MGFSIDAATARFQVGFGQQRSGRRINKAEKEIIRIMAIRRWFFGTVRAVVGGVDSQA